MVSVFPRNKFVLGAVIFKKSEIILCLTLGKGTYSRIISY